MRVTAERLRRLTEAILKSGGSAGSEAELVANHLVQANLAGHDMFAVLIDPARFAGVEWLRCEIDGLLDYVKASRPADPQKPVLVPGDPERAAHEERSRTGIAIDATTWKEILEAGEKVGFPRAEAEAIAGSDRA